MKVFLDLLVPGIIAGVSLYGAAKGVDVYEALLQGAVNGLDILLHILPAVWLTSALSVLTGIAAAKVCAKLWRR